jgi:cytochrome c oxidase subunit 3
MSDAAAHKPNHPYHLVNPSPWPLVGSIAGGVFFMGMVLYMHGKVSFPVGVLPGLALILITMFGWWRDVIKEAQVDKAHTPVVQIGLRYGMALFIASEVMFFVAFFWAFFDSALFPKDAIGGVWPPQGVAVLDPLQIPLLNTLILLLSGCTVTWSHHALREGDRKSFIQGLALTILLGIIFTGFQAYEYVHAPFAFKDGIYSSTFYMATGFHGFHVLVGTLFLIVCLIRGLKGHFTPDHHFGFEAAAWYWHFVDVVWLFLFAWVYIWGSGPGPYHG